MSARIVVELRRTPARLGALRYANGQLGTQMPPHEVARVLLASGYIRRDGDESADRAFALTQRGRDLLDRWETGAV